jgi:hypothetical protein
MGGLIELYFEMLNKIEKDYKSKEILVTHHPMKGEQYEGDLMVIGRAVNGWRKDTYWTPNEHTFDERKKYLQKLESCHNPKNECPLAWVKKRWEPQKKGEYCTKRSAFWRMIYKTMCELDLKEDWTSKIIWSNLYKVAPAANKNPSTQLQRAQREYCIQILTEEINMWRPKNLLFLTGMDWANPIIKGIEGFNIKNTDHLDYVDGAGEIKLGNYEARVIIAKHPQGKNESKMNREIMSLLQ